MGLGPPSGLHAVADDGSEGANREVLTRFESEDPRAVGIADDGEGDNRHRVTLTQCTRQTDGESAALSGLAPAHKRILFESRPQFRGLQGASRSTRHETAQTA